MIGLEREELTPAERVGRVLDGERPDRAPYFLNADLHAAALLGVPARELTSSAELATEGALAVQQRLGNDLVTSFIHSAGEAAAFGADVIEFDDGPANADAPPLTPSSLSALRPPPLDHPALALRLDVTRRLAARLEGRVLLLGAVIGPFSLPVMQLGFSTWLDLLHDAPTEAARLLAVNVEHDVAFARAQLAAGAAAILVFEPLASTEIVDPRVHRELGLPALARFGRELGGAFGVSAASAAIRGVARDLVGCGAAMLGAAESDDLVALDAELGGGTVLVGNLNGLRMARLAPEDVDAEVRAFFARAPASGRLLVAEHHGEVPMTVPLDTLERVALALRRHGRSPRGRDG